MGNETPSELKIPVLPEDLVRTRPEGLTSREAEERKRQGQSNEHRVDAGKSSLQILAGNLFTLFNLLNCGLAAALIHVGAYRNLLFMGVVLSNILIGTVQEIRTRRTIRRMQLLSESPVTVLRDGKPAEIRTDQLVLGDLVLLGPGQQVPADAVVTEGTGAANESLITGESRAVPKDRDSLLLSGSYISEGRFTCQLIHVGENSYVNQLQKIAKKVNPPRSRLMSDMKKLVRIASCLLVPIGILLFYKLVFIRSLSLQEAVPQCVAAMIGMLPEGLILLTSTALMAGVLKLSRKGTMVRQLYSIESLARVDTLCLDKTGTLTTGQMTLDRLVPLESEEEELRAAIPRFLGGVDTSSHTLQAVLAAFPAGDEKPAVVLPFSSERKYSAASFEDGITYAAGAPSFLLGTAFTPALKEQCAAFSAEGMRVLCFVRCRGLIADRQLPPIEKVMGLLLIKDEIRPGCEETLRYFESQHVDIKIISGDDPGTVSAIAKRVGVPGAEKCADVSGLTGDTPEEEKRELVRNNTVFGRVTPQGKCLLIEALKADGHTVAMTGDGVNDIPAMKASDCSIAMGSGSDAARRAAQLTMISDDYSTLPQVVAEGRRVINNIGLTASLFLIKTLYSFGLSLILLFLPAVYPFKPIQLTLISSLTVGIPAFFLAFEPNYAPIRGNFLKNVFRRALPAGAAVMAAGIVASLLEGVYPQETCSTIATLAAGSIGLVMLLSVCFPLTKLRTCVLIFSAAAFFLCVLFLGHVFYLAALTPAQCLIVAGMAAAGALLILLFNPLRKGRRAAS